MADYEFAQYPPLMRPTWEMVPEVIPNEALCAPPERIRKYPGIKEDVYVSRMRRDPNFLSALGIRAEEMLITVRPPAPMQRYLAGPNVGRECPGSDDLRAAFRIEVKRRQRRSDGTVSLDGQRLEIPSRYRHLAEVHLRYARWDLSRVDLIEARSGTTLCPVRPLDKAANADALRRRLDPPTSDPTSMPAAGIAPLLKQMIADYAATGLPPAYLPTPDKDPV